MPLIVLGGIGWLVIRQRRKRQAPAAEVAADSESVTKSETNDA